MQAFDPTGKYPAAAVLAALRSVSGARTLRARYDLLDAQNNYLRPLTFVQSGSVAYDPDADVKRTGKFVFSEGDQIDYASNRIKPWLGVVMPDGGLVEWAQGVFLLSTPTRKRISSNVVVREVEGFDQLAQLLGDLAPGRWTIRAGVRYIDAIQQVTTGYVRNITPTSKVLPTTREWDPGTPKLTILNSLLDAINYRGAYFDQDGVLIAEPYVEPARRTPTITYATDSNSVITGNIEQSLDLFSVANRWVLTVSSPDRPAITRSYTNVNPSLVTSTVRRGRVITDFRTEEDAADGDTLLAKARRLAAEASQVYETIPLETGVMPFHGHADVLTLTVNDLDVSANYVEQGWEYDLAAGGTMRHDLRRTVDLDDVTTGSDYDTPPVVTTPPVTTGGGDDGSTTPAPVPPDPGNGDPGSGTTPPPVVTPTPDPDPPVTTPTPPPTTPQPDRKWGYETGDLTQWLSPIEAKRPEQIAVAQTGFPAPLPAGLAYGARFLVATTDTSNTGTVRAEVRTTNTGTTGTSATGAEGAHVFYSWWAAVDADFENEGDTYFIHKQFHSDYNTGGPLVSFRYTGKREKQLANPRHQLLVQGGTLDSSNQAQYKQTFDGGALTKGSWLQHVLELVWSSDNAIGRVRWLQRVDGGALQEVVPLTAAATLYTGKSAYAKEGIYAGQGGLTHDHVTYATGFRRGSTLESVTS